MPNETQPIPYSEIQYGIPENYVSYGELTPEALVKLQSLLGKHISITFTNENWIYTGPDEEEDHGFCETQVHGRLTNVDKSTIGVDIITGETKYDSGAVVDLEEPHKNFPFFMKRYRERQAAEVSQICTLTVENQTFHLNNIITKTKESEISDETVTNAVHEITNIIASYDTLHIRPNITRIIAILEHVDITKFPVIYQRLAALENSSLGQILFDPVAEIMSAASSDRQFGALTPAMVDYYDNEVQAQSHGQQKEERVLDSVVELVQLVEKKRMELIPKPARTYVVLYDNGDDMQASHGKQFVLPEGEDPWEFARKYLLTITSAGENGLMLEDVHALKPGETFREF